MTGIRYGVSAQWLACPNSKSCLALGWGTNSEQRLASASNIWTKPACPAITDVYSAIELRMRDCRSILVEYSYLVFVNSCVSQSASCCESWGLALRLFGSVFTIRPLEELRTEGCDIVYLYFASTLHHRICPMSHTSNVSFRRKQWSTSFVMHHDLIITHSPVLRKLMPFRSIQSGATTPTLRVWIANFLGTMHGWAWQESLFC